MKDATNGDVATAASAERIMGAANEFREILPGNAVAAAAKTATAKAWAINAAAVASLDTMDSLTASLQENEQRFLSGLKWAAKAYAAGQS